MMADADDEKVGYRRPPRHSQFRKGRSGNPAGRPKGSGAVDGVGKTLRRKVTITVDGKREKVAVTDAIALQMTKQALAGNVGAGREVMRLAAQQAEFEARRNAMKPQVTQVSWVVIDPKDCSPGLEKLGVVVNIAGQYKIEPWVIEAALARDPGLERRLKQDDRQMIQNYTRMPGDKEGDPGRSVGAPGKDKG